MHFICVHAYSLQGGSLRSWLSSPMSLSLPTRNKARAGQASIGPSRMQPTQRATRLSSAHQGVMNNKPSTSAVACSVALGVSLSPGAPGLQQSEQSEAGVDSNLTEHIGAGPVAEGVEEPPNTTLLRTEGSASTLNQTGAKQQVQLEPADMAPNVVDMMTMTKDLNEVVGMAGPGSMPSPFTTFDMGSYAALPVQQQVAVLTAPNRRSLSPMEDAGLTHGSLGHARSASMANLPPSGSMQMQLQSLHSAPAASLRCGWSAAAPSEGLATGMGGDGLGASVWRDGLVGNPPVACTFADQVRCLRPYWAVQLTMLVPGW